MMMMMVIMLMFDTMSWSMMRLEVEASDNRHDYDDFFANDDIIIMMIIMMLVTKMKNMVI